MKMKLYHSSNVEVRKPQIIPQLRALDFGAGFYLTSSVTQASRWAKVVTKRRGEGEATLNCYELNETALTRLNILHFKEADEHWLDFVVANRTEQPLTEHYDLVIGPVADDATLPVIDDYMDGKYTKAEAVKRLLPQNLTDQYTFLTEKSLAQLTFIGSQKV